MRNSMLPVYGHQKMRNGVHFGYGHQEIKKESQEKPRFLDLHSWIEMSPVI